MDALTDWLPLIIAVVVGVVLIAGIRRQREFVRVWAITNNVTLVRRLPSWYRISPFPFAAAFGHQRIQYWLVRDAYGVEHRVWLKLGDFFLGSIGDQIVDEWES